MKLSEFINTIKEVVGEDDYDIQIVDMDGDEVYIWKKFFIKKTYKSHVSVEDALDETKATPVITIEIPEMYKVKLKIV